MWLMLIKRMLDMTEINRQWLINGNPAGRGVKITDFKRFDKKLVNLKKDELRIKVEHLEFTPSLKGQMENQLDYAAPTKQGQVMRGRGIGEVIESKDPKIKIGSKVKAYLGWQDFATLKSNQVQVVDNDKFLLAHLGPLGSSGMTAYFGFLKAGKPKDGNTVLISGAAGAVGTMVGQIAKIKGCYVVGTAGTEEKCDWLINSANIDAAINYKTGNLTESISRNCPDGANIIFDNVGGEFLDSALDLKNLAIGARVVLCGAISRYETFPHPPGPTNYFNLILRRANMQGILSPDYASEFPQAVEDIKGWLDNGKFIYREDIQNGFKNIPSTFLRLFSGQNKGKQLIKL